MNVFLALFMLSVATADVKPPVSAFEIAVPHRPTIDRTSGRTIVRYELHLTNVSADEQVIDAVRVLDGGDGSVLADLRGVALSERLQLMGDLPAGAGKAPLAVASGGRAVVYIDLDPVRTPESLRHGVAYRAAGGGAAEASEGPAVVVDATSPVVLGPPLRGGPWVAVHSPDWPRGHRRVFYASDGVARLPGRYAIDWVGLDIAGATTRGVPDRPGDAIGYGATVIAVADAVVADVRDGMAESATIEGNGRHSASDAAGNYVVLDLGQGRFAFYEHLKPGSIRVRAGETVRRGQAIAALGFTGDSTGPHLHFHVADGAKPLGAEGLPFVFDRFTQCGRYEDLADLGRSPWSVAGGKGAVVHERPAANVVVSFDDRKPAAEPCT